MKHQVYKIAILGDGGVGKSSLLRARTQNSFTEESQITIGVDVACIPFEYKQIDDNKSSFLAIDLGGQDRFHFIHDAYLNGAKCALILYDTTRYRSFMNLDHWYHLIYNENPIAPVLIVGTKADLVDESTLADYRDQFKEQKAHLPNPKNVVGHYFISSKTQDGVNELFLKCEEIMKYTYSIEGTLKITAHG